MTQAILEADFFREFKELQKQIYALENSKGTEWVAPTLANSFASYGSGFRTVGYRKSPDNKVQIRGLIKNEVSLTANTYYTIFTLPEGFRPSETEIFMFWGVVGPNPVATRFDIFSNGEVRYFGQVTGTVTYMPITSLSFYAD